MSTENTIPKLLTAQQLSEKLGVPLWTVRALAKRGLKHVRIGNKLFFPEDGIAEWFQKAAQEANEKARRKKQSDSRSKRSRRIEGVTNESHFFTAM